MKNNKYYTTAPHIKNHFTDNYNFASVFSEEYGHTFQQIENLAKTLGGTVEIIIDDTREFDSLFEKEE